MIKYSSEKYHPNISNINIIEKENDFSLKNKINDLNFYFNNSEEKNLDNDENEDC